MEICRLWLPRKFVKRAVPAAIQQSTAVRRGTRRRVPVGVVQDHKLCRRHAGRCPDAAVASLLVQYVSTVSEVEPDTVVEYVSDRIWTTF